jgi:hypothetical protein
MRTRRYLVLLLLLGAAGCGSNPVKPLIEEELEVTRQLTKMFNDTQNDKMLDYAVVAMEPLCVSLASIQKKREELVAKMSPAQIKSLEGTAEFQELTAANGKMLDAFREARRRNPARSQELVAVWKKAGLRDF